ncbi:MAG: hypothetical protein IPJ30_12645 [Acidobacteria bacterium]|nr:hypothetical protein [Acidobacteriota bacterium]
MLNTLSEAAKYWFIIHNPFFVFQYDENASLFDFSDNAKRLLRKLLRNRYGEYMKPLILAYFIRYDGNHKSGDIDEALWCIERHNYCVYLFAGRQADTNRADFNRVINQFFRGVFGHQGIVEMLNEEADKWLTWRNVFAHIHQNRANNKKFYDWNGAKYTLWEWEKFLEDDRSPILEDYSRVEVYPILTQTETFEIRLTLRSAKNQDRDSFEKLCYSLGNLSINKTQRANYEFARLRTNLSSGSYSDMEIANTYDEWTDRTILNRGIALLRFIENNWRISYSDISSDDLQSKAQTTPLKWSSSGN